ncbi:MULTISPECIES: hypothetical protein [Vagococcus]|uniref:hypothetical protein n=1 Tax=Vagococcus TaxID=2737 RepID=UPI002FC923F8
MKKKTIIFTLLSVIALFLITSTLTLASTSNTVTDTRDSMYQENFSKRHMNKERNYEGHCHNNNNFNRNNHHMNFRR